jgi:tetratricopeptide (TPR) repeat protein
MNRSVWIYLLRGIVLGQMKKYPEADADFATALALAQQREDPGALYALYNNRAVIRLECRDYAGAEKDLHEALKIRPDQFHAYFTLSHVSREQNDPARALAALDRGLGEARKRFDAGKLAVSALLLLHRQRLALYREQKSTAAALAELSTILSLPGLADRERAETQRERGQLLYQANKLDDALAAYEAVLVLSPDDTDALRWRAEVLLGQKRHAEAAAAFDRYLGAGGQRTARIYRSRALARLQLKQHDAAVADFTLALALEPGDLGLRLQRGRAYLTSESWQAAAADFEEVVKGDPGSAEGYHGRGLARLRLGRARDTAADADQLARLAGRDAGLVFASACLLAQAAGQTTGLRALPAGERLRLQERAVVLLRRALELLPPGERAAFWDRKVHEEPALRPVRAHPAFTQLQRHYRSAF